MGYLPKSQFKVLHTSGGELVYKNQTSREYTGPYIETGDNRFFAGNDIRDTSIVLEKITTPPANIHNSIKNQIYNKIKPSKYQFLSSVGSVYPTKPVITKENYKDGKIIRYFAYRVNTYGSYIEIDKKTYKALKTKKKGYDYNLYKVGKIDWMLEGDTLTNNHKLIQQKEKEFPGISLLFPILNEFQKGLKSKYNIKGRVYTNGEEIAPNLPPAYALSNKPSQFCQNCRYNENNHCKGWGAKIKSNYWCKKWKAIDTEIDIKMEAPEYKPPTTPKGPRSYSSIKSSGGGGGY